MSYGDIDYDEPYAVHPMEQHFHDEMTDYKNTLHNQVYVILNYLYGEVELDKDKFVIELEDLCGLVDLDYNIFQDLAIESKKGK